MPGPQGPSLPPVPLGEAVPTSPAGQAKYRPHSGVGPRSPGRGDPLEPDPVQRGVAHRQSWEKAMSGPGRAVLWTAGPHVAGDPPRFFLPLSPPSLTSGPLPAPRAPQALSGAHCPGSCSFPPPLLLWKFLPLGSCLLSQLLFLPSAEKVLREAKPRQVELVAAS